VAAREDSLLEAPSEYELKVNMVPMPVFAEASIMLNAESENLAAEFVHELLHLNLSIAGYPCVVDLDAPASWRPVQDRIKAMFKELANAIDHLTFYEDFLKIGIDKRFFVRVRASNDMSHIFRAIDDIRNDSEDAGAVALKLCYTYEKLSEQFVGSDGIEATRRYGETVLNGFPECADAIDDWVSQREYITAESRRPALWHLMDLIEGPNLRFAAISRSQGRPAFQLC
jgi:hypothetical protein